MSNDKFFPATFWDSPWTDFFEEFDQEEFDKVLPPNWDLLIDDNGKFIATNGLPFLRMRLTKLLRKPPGKMVFFLLKSQFINSILKKHDLRSWLQNALEMVHFEHVAKKDSGMKDVTVPAILLAALIQRVQETELVMEQFGEEIEKIREVVDEHTFPGVATNTGRFSSEHPNMSNPPDFEHVCTETGRVTSKTSNVEEIERKGKKKP